MVSTADADNDAIFRGHPLHSILDVILQQILDMGILIARCDPARVKIISGRSCVLTLLLTSTPFKFNVLDRYRRGA